MKSPLRDRLTITAALLAILLCGYAIGFLIGEKKGSLQAFEISIPAPSTGDKKAPWVERTLSKFDQDLQLTSSQKKQARDEIEITYDEIRKSRISALRQYSRHITKLHTRLLPHLDHAQKKIVLDQNERLKETLDLGLP